MNKSITAAAILGSLASLLVFQTAPASARPCEQRYLDCTSRCWSNNSDPLPCINRTCLPQNQQCTAGEGPSGGGGKGKPTGGNKPKGESKGGKPSEHANVKSAGGESIITSDQGGGGSKKTPRINRDHRGDKKRERPVWRDQVILRDHRVRYGYHCPHSLARQHKCIPWNTIIRDHRAGTHYGRSPYETAVTQPQWKTPSILEPTGGFSPQGPAAMGSPARPGAAPPPVIIR